MKKQLKISQLKENINNPRLIKGDKFKKLVKSIKEFPEMLELRPIVVDENMVVLGGNMRLKACKEAGLKEVWVDIAENLTEEQKKEFIIKDNVGFGEWEWDMLANEWDAMELTDWGLDTWQEPVAVDYSILDDDDTSKQLEDMANGVKKAIQIEFYPEDYASAYELIQFWREQKLYVGGFLVEKLKEEKNKA
ncbi:MAG TPA: ParB N-terminal domain-containing protein [Candidatus Paceibacterota bacterium]|nr:ParB N-terminal domain-containing protein [Candidatus Paceibacterota bacterium]